MAEETRSDKKRIIVTGGAGFLGSFVCERLLNDGHQVICVDSLVTSQLLNIQQMLKNPDFEFIKKDVSEGMDIEEMPELEKFDLKFKGVDEIYHFACPMSVKNFEQNRITTLRANSLGMYNALEMAVKHKAKFFLASTSVIYGDRPEDNHPLKEEEYGLLNHLEPRSCYDEGRRWAETMAYTYEQVHGLDVRVARIFRTYGPRMPLEDGQMLPDFVMNAIDGKDLVIYGDEGFRSSFIYVTDVVDGIVRLMGQSKDPGTVNLGSDYDLKISKVAERIIELTGSGSAIAYMEPLPFMRELGLPNLTRAKDSLGWIPLVSLDQGLKKLVEYTVANKNLLKAGFGGK